MPETVVFGVTGFVVALALCTVVIVCCCIVSGRASGRGR